MSPAGSRSSAEPGAEQPALVLAGPPGNLSGRFDVTNDSERRLALRGVVLRRDGGPDLPVTLGVVLPPGGSASVPVSVHLEPTTPPGESTAVVDIGGVRRPVVLRVREHPSLVVEPDHVLAGPGTSPLRLQVRNDGNVVLTLAPLVRAATFGDGPDPGPDVELAVEQPPELAPGEQAVLTATLTVPTLDPTRRHEATLPVAVADLTVTVLPRAEQRRSEPR